MAGENCGNTLGAPVEGWTYDRIRNIFGEVTDYLVDYHEFAADDDSNGPFSGESVGGQRHIPNLTAQDVGEALLNYAPFEHGFFGGAVMGLRRSTRPI